MFFFGKASAKSLFISWTTLEFRHECFLKRRKKKDLATSYTTVILLELTALAMSIFWIIPNENFTLTVGHWMMVVKGRVGSVEKVINDRVWPDDSSQCQPIWLGMLRCGYLSLIHSVFIGLTLHGWEETVGESQVAWVDASSPWFIVRVVHFVSVVKSTASTNRSLFEYLQDWKMTYRTFAVQTSSRRERDSS